MSGIKPWKHKVQYYETDQMGIVHHSNYIRWFEEARVDMLEQVGAGYDQFEADGVVSPVLGVEAKYLQMVRFGETVEISAAVESFNGVRLTIAYTVRRCAGGEVCCTGKSRHCFLGPDGRPVSLKRSYPEYDEAIRRIPVVG